MKLAKLACVFFLGAWSACAQSIITTVAGNGNNGFPGDGGPATAAALNFPDGVASDAAGNLYIVDGNRIRKVSAGGVISTVAGNGISGFSGDGGPATSASLNSPGGVAVDAAGNVYIADTSNSRVRKVTPAGIITTVAGSTLGLSGCNPVSPAPSGDGGPATSAVLCYATAVAVDAAGNLYIADEYHNFRLMRNPRQNGPRSTNWDSTKAA